MAKSRPLLPLLPRRGLSQKQRQKEAHTAERPSTPFPPYVLHSAVVCSNCRFVVRITAEAVTRNRGNGAFRHPLPTKSSNFISYILITIQIAPIWCPYHTIPQKICQYDPLSSKPKKIPLFQAIFKSHLHLRTWHCKKESTLALLTVLCGNFYLPFRSGMSIRNAVFGAFNTFFPLRRASHFLQVK